MREGRASIAWVILVPGTAQSVTCVWAEILCTSAHNRCKQQIVGKARPCSAWYNLFCWPLMQFFILTNISAKSKNLHFSEKTLIDVCRRRNDVLWDALANPHICNVLSFNTCSTIFTKSRTRHTCYCSCSTISTKSVTTPFLDARASLARCSLKGRVVAGGWGWTFGGFERFCWKI